MIEKRRISILNEFHKKVNEFFEREVLVRENIECSIKHSIYNMDYQMVFDKLEGKKDKCIIYADPPYFKEHYSRYYHILDTLCQYDYPSLTYNVRLKSITVGRYRDDRSVSPFGKKKYGFKSF